MALADTAALIASLELQDKFSSTIAKYDKAVAGMQRKTGTLEKVGFQIGRGARNTIDNVGKIAAVGAGLVASQVALGIRSLAQLQEIENQTAAVIKSTGGAANVTADQIRAQAEALEDLSTVDDKAIQQGQNLLLTFTNIRNEAGKGNDIFTQATETLLDLSVAMGTEPKQAAVQLGKALNDPIKGITALTRVGVTFTEEQKKEIEQLVKHGKTIDAQRIIIAELNREFGGSAKAFGEGPGATMRRFGDAVEGAQQALATGFLPVMEKVSKLVQDTLADPQVKANITAFGEGLAGGVEDLIDIGSKLPWDAIGNSAKLMGQGAKALLDAFTGLPPWIQTAVLTGWGLNKLTGGALGNIAGTLTGSLAKGLFGQLRGSNPATPVFTKEVGIPGAGAPGAGGPSLLGRVGGALGFVGVVLAAVEGLHVLEEAIDGVGFSASKEGHSLLDNLFGGGSKRPQGAATPIGQFNPANQGGVVPVKVTNQVSPGLSRSLGLQIRAVEKGVRQELKEGDLHNARLLDRNAELLNTMRGSIREGFSDVIPHLGRTNRALSVANRNLENGNARQRELAARVREQRDAVRSGFDRNNAQLGIIAKKDFSPNVNVTVPVTTNVSISDIVRQASTYNVATSYASQTRRGFEA